MSEVEGQGQRHGPYFELKEHLAERGCPVCRLARRSVRRYLDGVSYESVNDPALRERLRAARGLCHRHGWQFLDETRDPLGLALIERDVVNTLAGILTAMRREAEATPPSLFGRLLGGDRGKANVERLAADLAPQGECPACGVQQEAERRHAGTLVEYLAQAEIRTIYEGSGELCLPHFALALGLASDGGVIAILVDRQAAVLAELGKDLAEYARKHDYRFRHEPLGPEKDVPARALAILVGPQ